MFTILCGFSALIYAFAFWSFIAKDPPNQELLDKRKSEFVYSATVIPNYINWFTLGVALSVLVLILIQTFILWIAVPVLLASTLLSKMLAFMGIGMALYAAYRLNRIIFYLIKYKNDPETIAEKIYQPLDRSMQIGSSAFWFVFYIVVTVILL